MTVEERRALIEERLRSDGEVDFASLAAMFEVSEMTIRRDIDVLETQGAVRRVRGGAIAYSHKAEEPAFGTRVESATAEKAHIATAAVELSGAPRDRHHRQRQHRAGRGASDPRPWTGFDRDHPECACRTRTGRRTQHHGLPHRRTNATRGAEPHRLRCPGDLPAVQLRHLHHGRRRSRCQAWTHRLSQRGKRREARGHGVRRPRDSRCRLRASSAVCNWSTSRH